MSATDGKRPLFISYRRADNRPPPDVPKAEGYITHFCRQLYWELDNAGLSADSLWIDRNQLEPADKFTEVIQTQLENTDILLAILSNGYVSSGWCCEEVDYFAQRLQDVPDAERKRRIFRVDKHEVVDADLPEALQNLQAVRLYEKDPESGVEREFYYRGKLRRPTPYREAINELAVAIRKRIQELGLTRRTPGPGMVAAHAMLPASAAERPVAAKPGNGRTVYVAMPAFELEEQHSMLVRELRGRGFTVLPDGELPRQGTAALAAVRAALAQAEISVHLLGEKKGFQPEELSVGIVTLQLAEAAAQAARTPGFRRLIWAPKIMPDGEEGSPERDPLEVLERYDACLASDEVDGDTTARFNDFVVQTLRARAPASPPAARAAARPANVYLAFAAPDQKLAMVTAKRLKESGAKPMLFPNDTAFALASRADHVVVCWGAAEDGDVLGLLDRLAESEWRAQHPDGKLLLLTFDAANESQDMARELDSYGAADAVLDGNDPAALDAALPPPA